MHLTGIDLFGVNDYLEILSWSRPSARKRLLPQKTFTTAEDASEALGAAYTGGNNTAVAGILGRQGVTARLLRRSGHRSP